MRTPVAILAAVLAALVVASPLVAGERSGSPVPAIAAAEELVTDAVALPVGASVVPMSSATPLEISLTLAYPDPGALDRFLSAVEDPSSPLYRSYLTHAEFESTFAPSTSATGTVVGVLDAAGAREVSVAPDRLSVVATLSAAAVGSLFDVRMVHLSNVDGGSLYTAAGTPTLPSSLVGLVSGVTGLSNSADLRLTLNLAASRLAEAPKRLGDEQFIVNNSSGEQFFIGSDFTQAFQATGLFPGNASVVNPVNASYPTGVAIATLLASGYNTTTTDSTPPWDPAVVRPTSTTRYRTIVRARSGPSRTSRGSR